MNPHNPNDVTQSFSDQAAETVHHGEIPQPAQIGRYRVEGILGRGGFGLVYLAHDSELDRQVAIKVPYAALVSSKEEADAYLLEARTVANLDHPHIVPVYDVGTARECDVYIVSKYINGETLRSLLDKRPPTIREAAELTAKIADAVHYAHKRGLVHRDIKPGNVLIDRAGQPFVVDFGLALKESDVGRGPRYAGTPAYMSPEQARGEGHRVDKRSDIFSLGVVFYELLTRRRPFNATSKSELFHKVAFEDPPAPSQFAPELPPELERICLKAMSNRAADRYSTAKAMAGDLRYFLAEWTESVGSTFLSSASDSDSGRTAAQPTDVTVELSSVTQPSTKVESNHPHENAQVVPKGLRSFDAHDADFFLDLLPGPQDRDGLPDVLRFWITRIEESDPDDTFSVGVIYGPSGCGKSSLVKAGLVPRLSEGVLPIYVECDPQETETRILHRLHHQLPELPKGADLTEVLTAIRRGLFNPKHDKILLVLDQFEQWLHANPKIAYSQLVAALRQCDGQRLQCVLLVRDDFWMGITRFMQELEVRMLDGRNSAAVDLFPPRHARKVLESFGRAFGDLPKTKELTTGQQSFLDQAVEGLARDGKIICVRLALFAEMMKGKPWTTDTLATVGGTSGIGVSFLDDTFSDSSAPELRFHQQAARGVLQQLLPEEETDIKGHMKSEAELLSVSGYAKRPRDFRDLIDILDQQLRLITPTDPKTGEAEPTEIEPTEADGSTLEQFQATPEVRFYQLTHDYLVQPLRLWLGRKQQETRRGRASLRLQEYSELWNANPHPRRLPSIWEFLQVRALTTKRSWTKGQASMMSAAARRVGLLASLVMVAGVILSVFGYNLYGHLKADYMVRAILSADTQDVPRLIQDLQPYRGWASSSLRAALESATSKEELHIRLALGTRDPAQFPHLASLLRSANPVDVPILLDHLAPRHEELTAQFWQHVESPTIGDERLRAASALARFSPTHEKWDSLAHVVAAELVNVPLVDAPSWIQNLRRAGGKLITPLSKVYVRRKTEPTKRAIAAAALADYLHDNPTQLVQLLIAADSDAQFAPFLTELRDFAGQGAIELRKIIDKPLPQGLEEDERNLHWKQQANAIVAMIDLGKGDDVWNKLAHSPNPSLRSYLIQRFGQLRGGLDPLVKRLEIETTTSIRIAIILALGQFDRFDLSAQQRNKLVGVLIKEYRQHPDSGIHSAIRWTLSQWQLARRVDEMDQQMRIPAPHHDAQRGSNKRRWWINSEGQTFAIIPGPTTLHRPKHRFRDSPKRESIPYSFAIMVHEVTAEQFLRFKPKHKYETEYSPQPNCPLNKATWFEVAAYCNWLSEREKIPRDQWCYAPNAQGKYGPGMVVVANWHQRTGYRMATEVEAEYINRAGAMTRFGFGFPMELLDQYDWYVLNSKFRMWPVGSKLPNVLGAFDTHGNAWEWCHSHLQIDKEMPAETITRDEVRRVRNGVFFNLGTSVASHERTALAAGLRSNNVSFRLARRVSDE